MALRKIWFNMKVDLRHRDVSLLFSFSRDFSSAHVCVMANPLILISHFIKSKEPFIFLSGFSWIFFSMLFYELHLL
jgi:hypothetical protein